MLSGRDSDCTLHNQMAAVLHCIVVMSQLSLAQIPRSRLRTSPPPLHAIQITIKLPPKLLARIIKPQLLVQIINLLYILGIQLKITPQIINNPRLSLTLWDNRVALRDTPCQRDLRATLTVFLAD